MDTNVIEGKWKQMIGEAKRQWGRLTDDDLDRIQGDRDKLVGLIQEKYGYAKETAEREVDQFLDRHEL